MIIVVSLVLIAGPLCVALWVMRVHPWCRRRKFPKVKSRRRLSKPFYRWAFRQGKLFTADSIDYFIIKYLRKYLRKRQKLCSDEQRLNEELTSISTSSDLEGSVHSEGSIDRSVNFLSEGWATNPNPNPNPYPNPNPNPKPNPDLNPNPNPNPKPNLT